VEVSPGVFKCNMGCNFTSRLRGNIQSHVRHVHLDPLVECDFCRRRYQRRHLAKHVLRTHLGVRPRLVCALKGCGRVFHSEQGLKGHVARHSPPEIACGACARLFHTRSQLSAHVLTQHAAERSHLCAECGATFVTRQLLASHAHTHAAGRAHACPVATCFFASKTRAGLNSHRLAVHPVALTAQVGFHNYTFLLFFLVYGNFVS
jgi:hypothetical protein